MVLLRFEFKIVCGEDEWLRIAGASFDNPLPGYFWQYSGYSLGLVSHDRNTVTIERDLAPGRHFVIFGTSSHPTPDRPHYYRAQITVTSGTGSRITSDVYAVYRTQYMFLAFDVSATGSLTKVKDGTVGPNQIPQIPPPPPPPSQPEVQTYSLTVRASTGGSVTVYRSTTGTPEIVTSGTQRTFTEPAGTRFRLDANPLDGYTFSGWYDDGNFVSGSDIIYITLDRNMTRTARFEPVPPPPPANYTLTIYVGSGGKLLVNGTPYTNTTARLTFAANTTVQLKAVPDNGYTIERFEIDGSPANLSSSTTVSITMNSNRRVSVSFRPVSTGGGGGTAGEEKKSDVSDIVNKMMDELMPPMMQMMGIMAMMQAMVGLMQGMVRAVAGGF